MGVISFTKQKLSSFIYRSMQKNKQKILKFIISVYSANSEKKELSDNENLENTVEITENYHHESTNLSWFSETIKEVSLIEWPKVRLAFERSFQVIIILVTSSFFFFSLNILLNKTQLNFFE